MATRGVLAVHGGRQTARHVASRSLCAHRCPDRFLTPLRCAAPGRGKAAYICTGELCLYQPHRRPGDQVGLVDQTNDYPTMSLHRIVPGLKKWRPRFSDSPASLDVLNEDSDTPGCEGHWLIASHCSAGQE